MKTDKLFYRIFLNQPGLISELVSGIPPDCEFEYSAPVIKENETRLDGLLTPVNKKNRFSTNLSRSANAKRSEILWALLSRYI
jgi:predicted transposase YdaD